MKKTLYYTVYYYTYDGVEQNGVREITVYVIEDNTPKTFAQFEAFSSYGEKEFSDEEEIQTYLDNNGYGDEEFELIEL